jgi:adenine-specific DNA-methyltransferase
MTDTTEDPIPRITRDMAGAGSGDVVAENVAALKALFPSIVTDGQVDFDVLRQLLGDAVDDGEERYGLNWKGKRRARAFALTPTLATLRPAKAESKEWDTTRNIVIEGDNLEVLKCLRRSYAGQVKLIYIDPPYNTGNDFVYPDNYADSLGNYERLTGQRGDDGAAMTTNKEASGRFHTDWLNMMYPRLMLAKELLRDDGALFVSCDENEVQNVRAVLDQTLGEHNFIAALSILSNPKGRSQDKYFASNHDYVVVYGVRPLPKGHFSIGKEEDEIEADYPEEDEAGKFRFLELRNTHREFGRFNRKDMFFPLYVSADGTVSLDASPDSEKVQPVWDDGFEGCWTWGKEKAARERDLLTGRSVAGRTKIYRRSYASGADRMLKTILIDRGYITERGQREFNSLFGTKAKLFQSPKSPILIGDLLRTITVNDDLILDFFAGSGTTGHAVMAQNATDEGNRRYILVQLPEPLDPANVVQKAAADFCDTRGVPRTIAELTKERLRRAGAKVAAENPDKAIDTGFRVYKLATSNLKPWQPDPDNLAQSLLDAVENILPDRSEDDLLVELLLKTGIDLTLPMQTRTVCQRPVHALGGGVLIVYLGDVSDADAEDLGQGIAHWHAELDPIRATTFYFRDSGFATAAAKANVAAIIRQRVGNRVEKLASI